MIREQIAKWIIKHCHATCGRVMNVEKETALIESDSILALPSGLEAVKKCECGNGYLWDTLSMQYVFHNACHGRGEIVRDLSMKEMREWAISVAEYNRPQLGNAWYLPSGERVRCKSL